MTHRNGLHWGVVILLLLGAYGLGFDLVQCFAGRPIIGTYTLFVQPLMAFIVGISLALAIRKIGRLSPEQRRRLDDEVARESCLHPDYTERRRHDC